MIKIGVFIAKNWRIFATIIVAIAVVFSFMVIWKKLAFAHPKVKELVTEVVKLDSTVNIQENQLQAFSDEVNDYQVARVNDSLRFYKAIAQHQINNKSLLNRAVYAEDLLSQYKGKGACRYPEDSIVGNWPNRSKFTVWRTKPCLD